MSGFSPEWLAQREPADHRSRCPALASRLARHFAGADTLAVVDLGCGSGSNLRAIAPLLSATKQHWTLVDHDPRLLAAARDRLSRWSDRVTVDPGNSSRLCLRKGPVEITTGFRQADLVADLDQALGTGADLVTASAFFDLCSGTFIRRLAAAVAARGAAFYTVLTYNGEQGWTPPHPADAAMTTAFCAHQMTDKGFGAAAGPTAPEALKRAFDSHGYTVVEGDSPWRLTLADGRLIGDLATGFAAAVRETGNVPSAAIDDWITIPRTGAVVGHTDTLALPRR